MKIRQLAIGSAVLILTITPLIATADETWNINYGRVVCQSDRGKTAIWNYPAETIFIEGLAGVKDAYYKLTKFFPTESQTTENCY